MAQLKEKNKGDDTEEEKEIQQNRGRDELRSKVLKWTQRDENPSEVSHSNKRESLSETHEKIKKIKAGMMIC